MSEPLVIVVDPQEAGRADHILGLHFPDASRKALAALFAAGQVRVDGKKVKKGHVVRGGQTIRLEQRPRTPEDQRPQPEAAELDIVQEEQHMVVLAKPPGMPTYPLKVGELGTLANRLVARFPECAMVGNDPREAGFAHRLDTHTSGLIVAARDQPTWESLRSSFSSAQVHKSYLAVVHQRPMGTECEEPLLQQGKRVQINYAGLDAYTSWVELERTEAFTLLRCQAHTGRMHQVRAHLAHVGSPIVGDTLYGGTAADFSGHFLHAEQLSLPDPTSGDMLTFSAPLPAERASWLSSQGFSQYQ